LTRKGKNGLASVVCEKPKACRLEGNGNTCWQPKTSVHSKVEYSGKLSTTNLGFKCANWNDQSVWKHNFLNTTKHNYCRNPDDGPGGPWCYVNNEEKFDHCSVPICKEIGNDFLEAQAKCGQRPEFERKSCYVARLENGSDAQFGEIPFQARIRSINDEKDHVSSGAIIASCWILTSAHEIKNFIARGRSEGDLRIDVGNRFYQSK